MKLARYPIRRHSCRVAVRNNTAWSAASSAGRGAKVHSTWPGPNSFSIDRSGNSSCSNVSANVESTGCIKSMLVSE